MNLQTICAIVATLIVHITGIKYSLQSILKPTEYTFKFQNEWLSRFGEVRRQTP